MRVCYALLATAVVCLAHSEVVSAVVDSDQIKLSAVDAIHSVKTGQTATTTKRFLRSYDNLDTEDDEERAVALPKVINLHNIDEIFNTKKIDEILDPKRVDDLLDGKKLGGWLDKQALDRALNGDFNQKKKVFASWINQRKPPSTVTKLLKSDPALEKKYRIVYKMYEGYLTRPTKKLSGNKRKRADV